MERELVGLLGAGLTAFASGYAVAVPVGAIDAGFALIDVLSREGGPQVSAVLDTMVQGLWIEWQRSGISRDVTQQHAGALTAVIELNRPPPELFAAALATAGGARMLAVAVVEAARRSADLQRAALDEGVCFQLLEMLFGVIVSNQLTLPQVVAATDLYLRADLWRSPALETVQQQEPSQAPAPPLPPRERRHQTSPPVLAKDWFARLTPEAKLAIHDAVTQQRPRHPDLAALEVEQQKVLAGLIERLMKLSERAPEVTTSVVDAALHLSNGRFTDADQALTVAQETLIHLAQADLGSARKRMQLAAEVLFGRATLEDVRLNYRKASRHYGAAVRGFTKADVTLQWHFLMQQAQALLKQDQLFDDELAMTDAIRIYHQAGELDTQLVGALSWASGQMRLAEILMAGGHRNGSSSRFLEAAQYAGIASNAFAADGHEPDAIKARLLQAEAFWLAGDKTGDPAALGSAAHAYRTALGRMVREQNPQSWVAASAALGQVLLRSAALNGDSKLLVEAIENLRGAIQYAELTKTEIDSSIVEASLGRALLAEYAGGGQPLLLDLAATAFRRALKGAKTSGNTAAIGSLQHELGMTLWAMAERAGEKHGLESATEMLEDSVSSFKQKGDLERAAAVQEDLDRLKQAPVSRPDALDFAASS